MQNKKVSKYDMVVFARSYSKIITVTSVLMSDMLGRTGMSSVGDRM